MIKKYTFTKKFFCLIICSFTALFSLAGCRQHDYKAETDEAVYNIIDQKWQDDFGSKANYKISDVQPSPNDIKIEKAIPDAELPADHKQSDNGRSPLLGSQILIGFRMFTGGIWLLFMNKPR